MINVQKLEKASLVSGYFSYLNCFIKNFMACKTWFLKKKKKKKQSLCLFAKIIE
jgi:hypothetical protein